MCDEFRTVVTSNEFTNPSDHEKVNQHIDKLVPAQLAANFQGDAFTSELVNAHQNLE